MTKRRKVYREGDRLNIYLPKGIDPNFLKWLNNRSNASNESLEIIMKFAKGELQPTSTIMMEGLLEKLVLLSSLPLDEIKNLNVSNQLNSEKNPSTITENVPNRTNELTDNNYSTIHKENKEENCEKSKMEIVNIADDSNNESTQEVELTKSQTSTNSNKKSVGGLNLNKGFKSKNFKNTGLNDLDKAISGNSIFKY